MSATFNTEKINDLLECVYTLTRARIGISDANFRAISFCPQPAQHTAICRIIRGTALGFEQCNHSDLEGFTEVKKTGGICIHKCHAGLTEAVAPIIKNGNTEGYILIGQYLSDNSSIDSQVNEIVKRCSEYVDITDYVDYIYSLPRLSDSEVCAACTLLQNIFASTPLIIGSSSSGIFGDIQNYISAHISENITVDQIAAEFKKTPSYIRKVVQDNTGNTIIGTIQALRMARAIELLNSTDLMISEIAEQCGIPDYNYFSRAFKKAFSVSPTKYRKSLSVYRS